MRPRGVMERQTVWNLRVDGAIARLAAAKGVTAAEFGLAWVLRRPGITAPIIGVRTMEHLHSCISAIAVEFSEAELAQLDQIAPPGTWVSDYWDMNVNSRLRPS